MAAEGQGERVLAFESTLKERRFVLEQIARSGSGISPPVPMEPIAA
jgi:hypothetical protein